MSTPSLSDVQTELTQLREALTILSSRLRHPEPDDGLSAYQRMGASECVDAAWRYLGEAVNYINDY